MNPRQDKRARKRSTEELGLPGAFEDETVTRRRLMTATVHSAGAIAAAAITLPALGFAIGPVFDQRADRLAGDRPAVGLHRHGLQAGDDYDRTRGLARPAIRSRMSAATVSQSTGRSRTSTTTSSRSRRDACTSAARSGMSHAAAAFVCPCHGGVYNFLGIRTGGPPPRPLDRFYTLLRDGRVLLGPRFSVDNELRRFSPRDPGQPLDGIGHFLYPARPSTAPAPPGAKSSARPARAVARAPGQFAGWELRRERARVPPRLCERAPGSSDSKRRGSLPALRRRVGWIETAPPAWRSRSRPDPPTSRLP